MFDTAVVPVGMRSVSCHGTLYEGSSKQGNARRASVVSNCVKAYQSSPSFWRKSPCVEVSSSLPVYSTCSFSPPGATGLSNAKPTKSSPPGIARTPSVLPPALAVAFVDREVARGEPEEAGLLLDPDLDVDRPAERLLAGIDGEVHGIPGRLGGFRQPQLRGRGLRTRQDRQGQAKTQPRNRKDPARQSVCTHSRSFETHFETLPYS